MGQLDKNIAINLKRIRKTKNMSLDMLAEKTGVSKSMLGQIERGESNPTVATIEKIVDGMKVSFEELIYPKEESILIIDQKEQPLYREKQNAYQIKAIFPFERQKNFEIYEVVIEPGEICDGLMTEEGMAEYIMVQKGVLTLETNHGKYEVSSAHAVRLCAEGPHYYANHNTEQLILNVCTGYKSGMM